MTLQALDRVASDPSLESSSKARSGGALAVGLLLAGGCFVALLPTPDPDVWWHLRVGEHILRTGTLVGPDPWARFAAYPYVATQWLPEALLAKAFAAFGVPAVLWLRTVAVLAMVTSTYAAARRGADASPAAIAAGLALMGAGASLAPRPQLLSFVFIAVTLRAWWDTAHDLLPRWWLVPCFWLWACCHGLWPLGIALGAVMTGALAADRRSGAGRSTLLRLGLLNVCTVIAAALTPIGPRLLTSAVTFAGNASWVADEWKATPLNNIFSVTTVGMLLAAALLLLRRGARVPWWQLALLFLAAGSTLWMWRLVPVGAILTAPLLATGLQSLRQQPASPWTSRERRRCLVGACVAAALTAAVCASSVIPTRADSPTRLHALDRSLDRLPAGTVVANDFGFSGWMLFRHQDLVPVADLRVEIYSGAYLHRYVDAEQVRPGWEGFVRSTGARYAVLQADSSLADALVQRLHWRVVVRDHGYALIQAPAGGSA